MLHTRRCSECNAEQTWLTYTTWRDPLRPEVLRAGLLCQHCLWLYVLNAGCDWSGCE